MAQLARRQNGERDLPHFRDAATARTANLPDVAVNLGEALRSGGTMEPIAAKGKLMHANVGPTDRAVRVVVGVLLLSLLVFVDGPNRWWGLLGLIPIATALLRRCPAYLPFGINTTRSK